MSIFPPFFSPSSFSFPCFFSPYFGCEHRSLKTDIFSGLNGPLAAPAQRRQCALVVQVMHWTLSPSIPWSNSSPQTERFESELSDQPTDLAGAPLLSEVFPLFAGSSSSAPRLPPEFLFLRASTTFSQEDRRVSSQGIPRHKSPTEASFVHPRPNRGDPLKAILVLFGSWTVAPSAALLVITPNPAFSPLSRRFSAVRKFPPLEPQRKAVALLISRFYEHPLLFEAASPSLYDRSCSECFCIFSSCPSSPISFPQAPFFPKECSRRNAAGGPQDQPPIVPFRIPNLSLRTSPLAPQGGFYTDSVAHSGAASPFDSFLLIPIKEALRVSCTIPWFLPPHRHLCSFLLVPPLFTQRFLNLSQSPWRGPARSLGSGVSARTALLPCRVPPSLNMLACPSGRFDSPDYIEAALPTFADSLSSLFCSSSLSARSGSRI